MWTIPFFLSFVYDDDDDVCFVIDRICGWWHEGVSEQNKK